MKLAIIVTPMIATPLMITMMFTEVGADKGFVFVFYYILNFSQIVFYVTALVTLLLAFRRLKRIERLAKDLRVNVRTMNMHLAAFLLFCLNLPFYFVTQFVGNVVLTSIIQILLVFTDSLS